LHEAMLPRGALGCQSRPQRAASSCTSLQSSGTWTRATCLLSTTLALPDLYCLTCTACSTLRSSGTSTRATCLPSTTRCTGLALRALRRPGPPSPGWTSSSRGHCLQTTRIGACWGRLQLTSPPEGGCTGCLCEADGMACRRRHCLAPA
jgi:hypothetical protein